MNHRSEGERVPEVTFRVRRDGKWEDVPSREVFVGRTVVLFALPGAFTPTCSSSHLPRYDELAPVFREHGVDEIVCVSVNDAFVMEAWGRQQNVRHVRLLPDGSGRFTAAMGMLVDKDPELDFGRRSWRYSMLVRDGVIEKLFVEPETPGDPYEVSDADTMLAYVAPAARAAEPALVFSREGCPHCARAKRALAVRGLGYEELVVGRDVTTDGLRAATGATSVPQVFLGGRLIGGADALEAELRHGRGRIATSSGPG